MKGRYGPQTGEKHIHRNHDGRRFSFTPKEEIAHATSYSENNNTRFSTATILTLNGEKVVYIREDVSLWRGEECSHECQVFDNLEALVAELPDRPHGQYLLDELIEKGLVEESNFVEDIDEETEAAEAAKKRLRQVRDALNKSKDAAVIEKIAAILNLP